MNPPPYKEVLKNKFGFETLRGVQEPVIDALVAGRSVLTLMPTGTGKSLCYQMMAFLKPFEQLVLVISPLIALMQDQVQKASRLGLRAACINSNISAAERAGIQKKLSRKQLDILFVTPERFRKSEFLEALGGCDVSLFVVDEAHCASLWGHDFRPDYTKLGEHIAFCGNPPVLALTATATPQVQKEICEILHLEYPIDIILGGIERPNLSLNVTETYGQPEKFEQMHEQLRIMNGNGIVYFALIQTLDRFSQFLKQKKVAHTVYHGDLSPTTRKSNQNQFLRNQIPLMLATPAFGLGVDKSDIRYVYHAEIPSTLESYFQEVGRAGRDGIEARIVLFYDQEDVSIQMQFLDWAYPEANFIQRVYEIIQTDFDRVSVQGFNYLTEQMVFKSRRDYRVNAAVSILDRWGALDEADNPFGFKLNENFDPSTLRALFGQEDQSVLKKGHQKKLLEMLRWARNQEDCRLNKIYHYFGYDHTLPCGICDVCRS